MPGSLGSQRYNAFIQLMIKSRQQAKLTQQQVADRLNKPQSYIAKFERGERRLDIIEFLDLADVLSIDVNETLEQLKTLPKS